MNIIVRLLLSLTVAIFVALLGSALVGYDVISAELGLLVWFIGFALAILVFIRTKPKKKL